MLGPVKPDTFATWGRGLVLNLVFAAWAQFIASPVTRAATETLDGQPRAWLGIVLLLVMALEPVLLKRRLLQIGARLVAAGRARLGDPVPVPGASFLAFVHLVLGPVLAMMAAESFGAGVKDGVGILFVIAAVFRELYLMFLLLAPPRIEVLPTRSKLANFTLDLGFVSVTCLGYAASWAPIALRGEPINQGGVGLTLLYAVVSGMLFLFFFLPARQAYVIEELLFATTPWRQRWLAASMIVAIVSALTPLVVIEDGRTFMTERRAKQYARERHR